MNKKILLVLALSVIASMTYASVKYLFLFIGDGMSIPQINSAELYLTALDGGSAVKKLTMSTFPAQGVTTTYDADSFIPDSASAGTSIACGVKTHSGVVGMDITRKNPVKSIAEIAKEKGMKVGILTSASLDHATPAVFYAHQASRSSYYDIANDLVKSGFDYFGGGGFLQPKGKKNDKTDIYELAAKLGYKVVKTSADMKKLSPSDGKVIVVNEVLAPSQALQYELDRQSSPSLADFTENAIKMLDNPNGFFMMVEGGKIDWSCHANDAASTINDVIAFDSAIKKAVEFYSRHPAETLIIVTGDHETGGMTIGFAGTGYSTYLDNIQNQKVSYESFDSIFGSLKQSSSNLSFKDVLPLIKDYFGLCILTEKEKTEYTALSNSGSKEASDKLRMNLSTSELKKLEDAFNMSMKKSSERPDDDDTYLLYGGYEPLSVTLTHILNQKCGISWTSYSHTGLPVTTFALGNCQELFNGYYDNTEIFKKMVYVLN